MTLLKQNRKIILLILVLLGASFYWFQYGPYKARKDCAWKRMHADAIPYKSAYVPKQTEINLCRRNCNTKIRLPPLSESTFTELFPSCEDNCGKNIPEQKSEPEKNWWGQTTETEYKACLRGKGF